MYPSLQEFNPLFFGPVFSKFCLQRRKIGQNRVYLVLWENSENQFGLSKKKRRQNFRSFFENPPPLEKTLDPPLLPPNLICNSLSCSEISIKTYFHRLFRENFSVCTFFIISLVFIDSGMFNF